MFIQGSRTRKLHEKVYYEQGSRHEAGFRPTFNARCSNRRFKLVLSSPHLTLAHLAVQCHHHVLERKWKRQKTK